MDQGVHILDLLLWWLGDNLSLAFASRTNDHYTSEVEDNSFLLLESPRATRIQIYSTVTRWKNLFRVEIATEWTLMVWNGLGNRNYGPEILSLYRRPPEGGRPIEEKLEFADADSNWTREWEHFYQKALQRQPVTHSPIEESIWILELIEKAHLAPLVRRAPLTRSH